MNQIRNVCVYCGSSTGKNPAYEKSALELCDYLIEHEMRLVNGGGNIGLMGVMANRMLERNAECYGVIPVGLKEREVAHLGMTRLFVVADMHTRKQKMVDISDVFIAMPGGFGTLDELFETLTWTQLNIHDKPVGLLNINNYFDPLVTMVDKMVEEEFLREDSRQLLHIADTIEDLFSMFQSPPLKHAAKWKT